METTLFSTLISLSEAEFSNPADDVQVIKNVVLLGEDSRDAAGNIRRKYLPDCMKNAVPLYEGVQMFLNHPNPDEQRSGSRDIRDLAGCFRNVRYNAQERKIRADFVGLPNDPGAAKFVNIARSMPNLAGCSQNAVARASVKNGIQTMESIEKVISVDLVCTPATTDGVFESESNPDNSGVKIMEYKDVTAHGLRDERPELVEALVKEGIDSRDGEVKIITEAKDAAELKVDEFQVAEAMRKKDTLVMGILEESGLPEASVTDLFKKTLFGVAGKDDAEITAGVTALIEDRQACLTSTTGGVIHATERKTPAAKTGPTRSPAQQAAGLKKR